jgi:hypothetical protein
VVLPARLGVLQVSRVCVYRDCGEVNTLDATHCALCGRPLIPHAGKPRCKFCGCVISYNAKTCMSHRDLKDPYEEAA